MRVAASKWRQILDKLPPGGQPTIKTRLTNLDGQTPGAPITIEPEIIPMIEGVPVELEPDAATVKVTFEIDQPTEIKTVKVSVRVLSPPQWLSDGTWREYQLIRKSPLEWRKDITVVGTKRDIAQLLSRAPEIDAYIILREEDKKEGSWWPKTVQIRLPADLPVKLVGEQKLTVEYKLEKRSQ